jgi:hypothetical protein
MKRLITAVSFAVLAVPAVAAQPFEQTELDRAVPQIADNASAGASRSRTDRGLPFEQTELDRALAGVSVKQRDARAAAQPWVDYNFIAPAL